MYRIDRNNYHQNSKNSDIQTPLEVSEFIYQILKKRIPIETGDEKYSLIFDPGCGIGNLLKPWKEAGYRTWGNDRDSNLLKKLIPDSDLDFLTSEKHLWESYFNNQEFTLILCNPPFNGYKGKLSPEVWLDKIIELFGKEIPIVLFTPTGLCSNLTTKSPRHKKFVNGDYPPVSSIIRLPKNIFPNVIFHSEILIFNIPGLEPHYFYQEPKISIINQ